MKPASKTEIQEAVRGVKRIIRRRDALSEAIQKRKGQGKPISRHKKRKKELTKRINSEKRKVIYNYGSHGRLMMEVEGIYKPKR